MERKVHFGFLDDEGFTLGKQLKEMGLEKVCSLDVPTYPALVKEFYMNLSRGDGGLISFVRGNRIHLTTEILGNLLEIPMIGPIANYHENRSEALSKMLGRDVTEFEEIKANQLPLELRLLHNICSRILFPKTGRFEYVSERDVLVMDSILSGHPINLPGMMIWYMAEAGSKKRSTLPYGMILTVVFRSQGIIILDNEPMKSLRHTDYYSKATLHRMGFVKTNGNWERRRVADDRTAGTDTAAHGTSEAEPSVREISPGPSCPAPSVPEPAPASITQSSTSFSDVQLEQLKSLFLDHEAKMKMEFESNLMSIRQQFYTLEDKFGALQSSLSSSSSILVNDIKLIFDKIKDIAGDSDIYSKCNAELQERVSTASALVDKRLQDFMTIQERGMGQILEELKRLFRH